MVKIILNITEATKKLDNSMPKSAWRRGVKTYAYEILETIKESQGNNFTCEKFSELEEVALNGAENWFEYSWGGCSLIYDGDIAKNLCTPSELKRTKGGELNPNSREHWLDVQARALAAAFTLIKSLCEIN